MDSVLLELLMRYIEIAFLRSRGFGDEQQGFLILWGCLELVFLIFLQATKPSGFCCICIFQLLSIDK